MRKLLVIFIGLILPAFSANSQNVLKICVSDSSTKEKLIGATVVLEGTNNGASTDLNGLAELKNIVNGKHVFVISYIGYKTILDTVNFPMKDPSAVRMIWLSAVSTDIEEVIVSSTRTNSRIEDLPVKVEVLGQDDMDEESTIVPGGIGSILGDLSVITIQKTNPVNGNDAVRMQGLDYKYTQMLRDGLPLYEGFSGSLGVLSIPPLDLHRVEIIKGSASTLFGGGAISGLINFISKTPVDSPMATLTLNQTTLKESNLNLFLSRRNKIIGTTVFAGVNLKNATDVNDDGFAEIPEQKNFIFHPRLFFYISKKANADAGITLTSDNRCGGDIDAIRYKDDSTHVVLLTEKVLRTTADGHFSYQFNERTSLGFKTTGSVYDRSVYYSGFTFSGRQISSYSELNYLLKTEKHAWVSGINFITEIFRKMESDPVLFGNYKYNTIGAFSQEDWQIMKNLMIEAGLRADYHSRYNWFILPGAGIFYKATENFSVRLHYGSGYKTPGLFSTAQTEDFSRLVSMSNNVKPEFSNGVNMDLNYQTMLFGKVIMQINQALYYTDITNSTIIETDSAGRKYVANAGYLVTSVGTDTYIRFSIEGWELYLGYNHTEAKQKGTEADFNMPFNPKDKFATTLAYEIEGKWRMGIEAAFNADQYIYNNERVPDFWFFAGMIERKFRYGSIVLNCENIGNYCQSDFMPLVTGTSQNPIFSPVWGPVEGRVLNLSLKIAL